MVMNTTAITASSHQQNTDKLDPIHEMFMSTNRDSATTWSHGKRGNSIEEGLMQFDIFFIQELRFLVSSTSATPPVISKFITDLFTNTDKKKTILSQRAFTEFIRFSHTSPKRFTSHWIYKSAALVDCSAARVWLAANKIL